jgi:DNA invertase Pin-like site-specific DNA recombinase
MPITPKTGSLFHADSHTVLGGLAEFERDLLRTRTNEGRERPKARDVKLGCKPN